MARLIREARRTGALDLRVFPSVTQIPWVSLSCHLLILNHTVQISLMLFVPASKPEVLSDFLFSTANTGQNKEHASVCLTLELDPTEQPPPLTC